MSFRIWARISLLIALLGLGFWSMASPAIAALMVQRPPKSYPTLLALTGNSLNGPTGIAVVGSQVWISNSGSNTISVFNSDGSQARSPISGNGLQQPFALAMVGSQVWVVNAGNSTVSRFTSTGSSAGSALSGNSLSQPEGIGLIGSQVWVSNNGTNSISRFTTSGSTAGTRLRGNGLSGPRDMAVIGSQVWVANGGASSILLYTPSGAYTGRKLTGNGMNYPEDAVIANSQVWVPNASGNTISLFDQTGNPAGTPITDPTINFPHSIAVVGTEVWVPNGSTNSITRFSLTSSTSTPTSTPVSTSTPTVTITPTATATTTATPTATSTSTPTATSTSTPTATSTPAPTATNTPAPTATSTATATPTATATSTSTSDPVIAAAGDIACAPGSAVTSTSCQQQATANLLFSRPFSAILTLGDNQYDSGTLSEFLGSFAASWGQVKSVIRPVPGNHEYYTSGASGYFTYFGSAAGDPHTGYYSYNLGAWHIIALNAECTEVGGCQQGSAEEQWLQADLAAHPAVCTLAYWHQPRFSGTGNGDDSTYQAFWQDLYAAHADVVLNGHSHVYERFPLRDPYGDTDPNGIREFVVGTGGENHMTFDGSDSYVDVRNNTSFGILEMTLHPTSYDWQFVPAAGSTFTDSGSSACHA